MLQILVTTLVSIMKINVTFTFTPEPFVSTKKLAPMHVPSLAKLVNTDDLQKG